jgi:hypothetical protein
MNADRRDVQFAARGPFIEGLDVLQDVLEAEAVGRDQFVGQPVKHERIVRVGRVAERQGGLRHAGRLTRSRRDCHEEKMKRLR